MYVVCAWCQPKRCFREVPVSPRDPCAGQVSHSICPECIAKFFPTEN